MVPYPFNIGLNIQEEKGKELLRKKKRKLKDDEDN
jgi:hypothetical protein